jgi:hypothetical protein
MGEWRVYILTMSRFENITGREFGRLAVVRPTVKREHGSVIWLCRCSCGNKRLVKVTARNLKSGNTRGCGCLYIENARAMGLRHTTHGQSKRGQESREYLAWREAKARCVRPSHQAYADYGGRGITMCVRWQRSFVDFFEDMGKCPDGLTLDRRDNDGNYEPSNCRWTMWSQQNTNKRKRKP